ncbi:MAG TPA: hypothetical protein VL651_17505, partial [Bacteroidia bacterium]|nr:hypothetical protein [Bacteroidia bacterium]
TEGFAIYRIDAKTMDHKADKECLFKDADYLKREVTEKYTNGVYQSTDFNFRWVNKNGEVLFKEEGSHNKKLKEPKIESSNSFVVTPKYSYLLKCEEAWTRFKQEKILASPPQEISFPILDRKARVQEQRILLSPTGVTLEYAGETTTIRKEELGNIVFSKGHLVITSKDFESGFFKNKGTHITRPANDVANVMLFMQLSRKWFWG